MILIVRSDDFDTNRLRIDSSACKRYASVSYLKEDGMSSEALYGRRWWALGVLGLSLFLISLDNTILNVALPTLQTDLSPSASGLQWIVDSYLLVFAGLLLVAGSLGDRFGRRRMLFAGLGIFGLGSLLAAVSGTTELLIASRALMGVGAAAIMPSTLSILTNTFPDRERAKAIAIWSGVAGLGVAFGPVVGGYLLKHFSWGSVFLVNIPFVVVAVAAGLWLVPESRDPRGSRLDPIGAVLSVIGLTTLVWAIIEAPGHGWTSASILGAFAAAAAVLGAFATWELRFESPMLPLRFFRDARFSAASISIALVFFSLFGVIFFLTVYLQSVLGYTALEAGVRTIPVSAALIVGSGLSTKLDGKLGTKLVVALGLVVVAAALGILGTVDAASGYGVIALSLVVLGLGMGLAMAPATESIMGSLPRDQASIGSAVNDTVRQVGGALGVAILGSVLSSRYSSDMDDAVRELPAPAAHAASDGLAGAAQVAAATGNDGLLASANHAFVAGMSTAAWVAAGVALAGAVIALIALPSRARERADVPSLPSTRREPQAVAA
jgi:EmrB/QacA subfamily drug resistance transporter